MMEDGDLLQVIIHGATAFELLRTAVECDLFVELEKAHGMDLSGVARSLGIEPQPARVLLLGLTSLRLLAKDGDQYRNTAVTRRNLLPGRPGYLGPLIEIQQRITNPCLVDLTESVRRNTNVGLRRLAGPGTTLYERLTADPRLQQIYYDNMGHASRQTFPLVAEEFDFTERRHVVDLGAGDGSNTITLLRRHEHLRVTMVDQPSVLELALRNVDKAGVGDRVRAWPGDMFTDPLPTDADAVLCSHIFEIWSPARNLRLLRRCHAALPDGGVALVYNFVSHDDNTGPVSAAFMSAYFLAVASGEGMVYSARDMEDCIRTAGFGSVRRYDGVGFHHALVAGFK